MGRRLYQLGVWAYAGLYILALAALAARSWGLPALLPAPGHEGYAGLVLIPLGLPWTLMLEEASPADGRWMMVTAPLANLLLIAAIRRRFSPG